MTFRVPVCVLAGIAVFCLPEAIHPDEFPLAWNVVARAWTAPPSSYQAGYDGTGTQSSEVALTPSTVSTTTFGKLGTYQVDDYVYSQGLYVPGVTIGSAHNLYVIATMNGTLYAFDADRPDSSALWSKHFNGPIYCNDSTPHSYVCATGPHPNQMVADHVGCLSTPAVDAPLGYVFAVCSDGVPYVPGVSTPNWKIHKVALTSGVESGTGTVIAGHVTGIGDPGGNSGTDTPSQALYSGSYAPPDSANPAYVSGQVQFWALWETNRVPLLINNGKVYSAWSGGDARPGHGWVMANNESDLSNVAAWCATCQLYSTPNNSPNTGMGSVWQSGRPMAIDGSGNIYLTTGNGSNNNETSSVTGIMNYGNSIVKLSPSLGVLDFFVPSNYTLLDSDYLDISSSGPTYIASAGLVVSCAKSFHCYSIAVGHMGHLQGSTGIDPQEFSFNLSSARRATKITGAYSTIWMNGNLYVSMVDGPVQRFALSGSTFTTTAAAATTITTGTDGGSNGTLGYNGIAFPGATISGSYNSTFGNNSSDLIWTTTCTGDVGGVNGNAFSNRERGTLRVFRGTDLVEVYNSNKAANSRDVLGTYAKFSPPVVANGHVYVPTFDNNIAVYGLLTARAVLIHP